mmetsp:Transcript_27044/g.35096  ORF Transcript_27044/g.35096 Transcript_27044/m.35096 type:complete len:274 (+) Transcript_27044:73-894(+)
MSLLNEHYLSAINLFFASDEATVTNSPSNKIFYLKKPLNIPKGSHMMLALNSFNVPYTWYQVRAGLNDTFNIKTYDGITEVEKTITIPEGTLLTLTANYTTNKFYFTSSVSMNQVDITNITCFKLIGANKNENLVYNNLTTMYFPNVFDFSGSSCLYVGINHRNIQNQNTANVDGILQKINIEVLPMEYIYFKPIELQYFETSTEHINQFDISIYDEDFNGIDFNGGVWRFGFTIHYNYDKDIRLHPSQVILNKNGDVNNETKEKKDNNKKNT